MAITARVEDALRDAMLALAKNEEKPTKNLLPGESWTPRRGGRRDRVPIGDIRKAAEDGKNLHEAADALGLSIEHLRRQCRKHGIEMRGIRKWVRSPDATGKDKT